MTHNEICVAAEAIRVHRRSEGDKVTIADGFEFPKKSLVKLAAWFVLALCSSGAIHAQDLTPRAYNITPVHGNAVTLIWSFYSGGLEFNGAVPIGDVSGTYNIEVINYYHSFSFFGRSANVAAFLPYGVGNFQGTLAGTQLAAHRSGLLDAGFRLSVNLKGGPAMPVREFVKWKQKVLLGASLKVIAPTGQYDPTKLVSWGINRWAFKPEFGYSQRWANWMLDGYAGAWFYTTNNASFALPNPQPQTQSPIGSLESHLSYDIGKNKRFWTSLDWNFWYGGATALNGIPNALTRQTSTRIGATASFPVGKHQSIKIGYSDGTYVRFGGNYQNVSVAWQCSWIGKP